MRRGSLRLPKRGGGQEDGASTWTAGRFGAAHPCFEQPEGDHAMKLRLATALALSLAFTQVAAPAAYATEASAFRSVEAQTFSQTELQRYGLSSADAAAVGAYQDAGYQVQVVSAEEAQAITGGQFSQSQWLVIGLIVLVVVVAVAAD
jgi:hypothetical protein